ncbi:MAG: CoA ester lyase [Burkholderiales bacterium]|nr:CoA ester lyase [Burkholderiales bacterium]
MALSPRDVLFVDGSPLPAIPACEHFAGNEKFIRRAFASQRATARDGTPLFDVLCDLEDGAAAGAERETAEMAAAMIASDDNTFGRAGVRVHDASHPRCMQDVEIIVRQAGARVAYIMLPKCDSRMDALKIGSWINHLAAECGLGRVIPMHVMIETHNGLAEVGAIAALPQVEGVNLGIMDFVSSHQGAIPAAAMASPGQFDHPLVRRAKLEVAAAALAHGAVPVHGVTRDYRDLALAESDARRARAEFGFLRAQSIHPDQIPAILAGMRPAAAEIAEAADILLAARAAQWGPIGHRGTLHDRASYRYYWQLLERAHRTGAGIPDDARAAFFH